MATAIAMTGHLQLPCIRKLHLTSLYICCCHPWTNVVARGEQLQLPCQCNYICHVMAVQLPWRNNCGCHADAKYICLANKTAVATSGATAVAVLAQNTVAMNLTNHCYAHRLLRWWYPGKRLVAAFANCRWGEPFWCPRQHGKVECNAPR